MNNDPDLENAKSLTYELVGRNVILLQHLEQLLKAILPSASLSGTDGSDLKGKRDEESDKLEMQTLGSLVKHLSQDVISSEDTEASETVEESGIAISLRYVHRSDSSREEHIDRLRELVDSRNQMVHHLLQEITQDDPASWVATHSFLEELDEKVKREIKMLQSLGRTPEKMFQLLKNPEVRDYLINGE